MVAASETTVVAVAGGALERAIGEAAVATADPYFDDSFAGAVRGVHPELGLPRLSNSSWFPKLVPLLVPLVLVLQLTV